VAYNWKLYYNLPAIGLWVLLVLAIVLVKGNRNIRSLLVLIPLLTVYLVWLGLEWALGVESSGKAILDQVAVSLAIGVAILWLLGHKIGSRNRFAAFLLALIVVVAVGVVGALSYGGVDFSRETVVATVLFGIMILVMLLSFVLTGLSCRKRYSPWRFILWLAVWTVTMAVVFLLGYLVVAMVVLKLGDGRPIDMLASILLRVLIAGLVVGACTYGLVIPYMVLVFRSSFYRERFYACLRLPGMGTPHTDKSR